MTPQRSGKTARFRAWGEVAVAVALAVSLSWVLRSQLVGTRLLLLWVMSVFVAWRRGFVAVTVASLTGVVIWETVVSMLGGDRSLPGSEIATIALYLAVSMALGRTVDNLRSAQRRVAQATDGMTDAMMVYDADWRLAWVNQAGVTLLQRLGIQADDARGRVLWDVMPALVGTPFETESRRAQAEQHVVEFEARYPDVDLWLQVRSVPTAEGGVATFAHDITSQRRADEARRRSEERYKALIEAGTVTVWRADPDGDMNDVPVWRDLTGQDTDELRGDGWLNAVHPDDRQAMEQRWRESLAAGEPYGAEFRVRHRDGSYRWYRSRAVPIRDDGEIVEWVGVLDDIHEEHGRRERHAAVDNALAVLGTSLDYEWNLAAVTRLLVPALADYCSVDLVDAAGDTRRVSSTHVDPEKELVLRDMWARYPHHRDDQGAPQVIATGEPVLNAHVEREAVMRYARTSEHAAMLEALMPHSFLCVPMSARGQVFGALSLVYSTSDRVYGPAEQAAVEQVAARAAAAIENARLYAHAQSASRAKSDFLATMSHELRTPLNAIAGYADLMTMGVRGPITEEQRRDLGRIRQNQQHLLEIITDILNFSRIEAGRTRYLLQTVRIADVLERMEAMIEPLARARTLTYVYVPPSPDLTVTADREKLEQVLINLLSNAVKFTPSGGRVTLSTTFDEHRVRIHVNDTGVGIAASQLTTIFEPFVQLEPTFTRTSEGTGLGLAISRELTRGMGGELLAESEPGKGSLFTVVLPLGTEVHAASTS
jgi:PAS domain S-box-containing protein